MTKKPDAKSSEGEKELDRLDAEFKEYDANIQQMTKDRMDMAPKQDAEPLTKMSQREIENSREIYLKPERYIQSKERFNEKFRDEYNHAMEQVRFIAENREIIGETIELWTKPFPGMPAEFWKIPTGKPVYGPRHLEERLHNCQYHRLVMKQHVVTETNHVGQMFGALAADETRNRLDAVPAPTSKNVFMGKKRFA
jgi:hypothetical protein